MKPTGLLVAVAVLAVLGGLIWWSNKKQGAASKTPTDTSVKLLSIPDDQFQEIRIKKLTGEVQDLRRLADKAVQERSQDLALANPRELQSVTLHRQMDVVVEPAGTRRTGTPQRQRKSASTHPLRVLGARRGG